MSSIPTPGTPQGGGEGVQDKPSSTKKDGVQAGGSLEGLLSTLKQQIKDSNWLETNTAERWQQENPKLAAEYKKLSEGSETTGGV